MLTSGTTLVPAITNPTATSPLLATGNLNGKTVRYEETPCCTAPRAVTSVSMVLATTAFGVGFVPGVPTAVMVGGATYFVGTALESANSWLAKDKALKQQIDRFENLLKGFGIQVTLLGKNGKDVQNLVDEMDKLFKGQQEAITAFQQRESQTDESAATTAQARLEAAVGVNQQMTLVLGEVCGFVDKMNALASAKTTANEVAATTQVRLQEMVRQIAERGEDATTQIAAMQRAANVFVAIREELSKSETKFNEHLGRIVEQAASLQDTTERLSEQVESLKEAETTAKERSAEATKRFQEAQAASAKLSTQLKELQEVQGTKIAELEGKVKLLKKALQIASNNNTEQLKAWLEAAKEK